MKKVLSLAKYQLLYFKNAVFSYCCIILVLSFFTNRPGSGNTIASSQIFVFVLGLNWFKNSFMFSQANNVSRRTFYLATTLAAMTLCLVFTVFDGVLEMALSHVHVGLYGQLYPPSLIAQLLWSAAFLIFSVGSGWLITMLYYRANLWQKLLISFSPVLLYWAINSAHNLRGGGVWESIWSFLRKALGMIPGEVPNPYPSILSFVVASIVIWALNSLLMYRISVKA